MSEIMFFDIHGDLIPIVHAENPGRDPQSNPYQPAWPNIADNDTATKWFDASLGVDLSGEPKANSRLVIETQPPARQAATRHPLSHYHIPITTLLLGQ